MTRPTILRDGAIEHLIVPASAVLPSDPASVARLIDEALADPDARRDLAHWLGVAETDLDVPATRALAIARLTSGSWAAIEISETRESVRPIAPRHQPTKPRTPTTPVRPTERLAWIAITVVGAGGLDYADTSWTLTTPDGDDREIRLDADSTWRVDDLAVSGTCHLRIGPTIPQPTESRSSAPINAEHPRIVRAPRASVALRTGIAHTVVVEDQRADLLRVDLGALGFMESSVLTVPWSSSARWHPWTALAVAATYLRDHPGATYVAIGHHEAEEPSTHSRVRAEALVCFIEGDRSSWVAAAAKWGNLDNIGEVLGYLRDELGWGLPELGSAEARTAAVLAFQQIYNAKTGAEIYEDGVVGEQTLGAIYDVIREEMLAWLELHGTDPSVFVSHDFATPVLACGQSWKPYRTMPERPTHHRDRFVDLVIIPAGVSIDLESEPTGAAIYDAASIATLSLDAFAAPQRGMTLEVVLRDANDSPIADAVFEVRTPGGSIRRGTLDARGEATIVDVMQGRCHVRFPDLAPGSWMLHEATLL